jgi:hypothetical protein
LFLSLFFCLLSTAGDEDLVFTAEPQDAVVSKNSSVVIDCGVPAGWLRDMEEAGPAPFIEWKRDGVLLSLNGENRRYFVLFFSSAIKHGPSIFRNLFSPPFFFSI